MDRNELIRAASWEAAGVILFNPIATKGDIADASDLIAARILDAIEPLIRAEARAEALEFCCQDRAAQLRAQVEALRGWPIPETCDPILVKRADVLALINGSSDEQ